MDCAAELSTDDRPLQIADIGTGSGAIAVTLAKHLPGAQIVAVDRSAEALRIAAWNAAQHEVESQIEFVESDLLSDVPQPSQFDLICSNPPYVSEAEFRQLAPTVRDFEPAAALVSGPKGTEVIERIVEESKARLKPAGRLIVELSPMIADACEQLAESAGVFDDLRFIKDLAGMRRVLSLRRRTDASAT
jgi:release factor glutamine methyltransferase